jgi:hypothetical protein
VTALAGPSSLVFISLATFSSAKTLLSTGFKSAHLQNSYINESIYHCKLDRYTLFLGFYTSRAPRDGHIAAT